MILPSAGKPNDTSLMASIEYQQTPEKLPQKLAEPGHEWAAVARYRDLKDRLSTLKEREDARKRQAQFKDVLDQQHQIRVKVTQHKSKENALIE